MSLNAEIYKFVAKQFIELDDEFQRSVILETLTNRRNAPPEQWKDFEKAIKRFERVKGFRPFASLPRLTAHIMRSKTKISALALILKMWHELNSDLAQKVDAFLDEYVEIVIDDGDFQIKLKGYEGEEEFDFGEEIHKIYDEIPANEAGLMALILIPGYIERGNVKRPSFIWDEWLEQLQALPSDAKEWGTIDTFIEQIRKLAEKKQSESLQRQEFESTIKTFIEEFSESIAYFEFTDEIAAWVPQQVNANNVIIITTVLSEIQKISSEYHELRNLPKASSFRERKQRAQKLNEMEEQIQELFEYCNKILQGDDEKTVEGEDTDGSGSETNDGEISGSGLAVSDEKEVDLEAESEETSDIVEKEQVDTDDTERTTQDSEPEPVASDSVNEQQDIGEESDGESTDSPMNDTVEITAEDTHQVGGVSDENDAVVSTDVAGEAVLPVSTDTSDEHTSIDETDTATQSAEDLTGMRSGDITAGDAPQSEGEAKSDDDGDNSAKSALIKRTNLESWNSHLWQMVKDDDIAGAYWLSRAYEAYGFSAPVPHPLLAALAGSRWVRNSYDEVTSGLLGIVNDYHPSTSDVQIALLGLAASLSPTLLAPNTGMISWLKPPSNLTSVKALYELIQTINNFAQRGIALQPDYLRGAAGRAERHAKITQVTQEVRKWLKDAPKRRGNIGIVATTTWGKLVRGRFKEFLNPIINDERSQVEKVAEGLKNWQDIDYATDAFNKINKKSVKHKYEPLSRPLVEMIYRGLKEALVLAEEWCQLVKSDDEYAKRGDWMLTQIQELREKIDELTPDLQSSLIDLKQAASLPMQAAVDGLLRSVSQLRETLGYSPLDCGVTTDSQTWLIHRTKSLNAMLNQRLILCPELTLDDTMQPIDDVALRDIPRAITTKFELGKELQQCIEEWIKKEDYRFVYPIPAIWLTSGRLNADIERICQSALDSSRSRLLVAKNQRITQIEKGLIDGLISNEERTELSAIADAIEPEKVWEFSRYHTKLDSVFDRLTQARNNRISEQEKIWKEQQKLLAVKHGNDALLEQFAKKVQKAIEDKDARIVDEYLANVRDVLAQGRELTLERANASKARDVLADFIRSEPQITNWLVSSNLNAVMKVIGEGNTKAGIQFARIPVPRRKEARQALGALRRLKQTRGGYFTSSKDHIKTLLQYLGFEKIKFADENAIMGRDWMYLRVSLSASEVLARPIPQFGTRAPNYYDVVCLWDRPGADAVAARLEDLRLSAQNVIVFFLGRMSNQHRRELTQISHKRNLTFAVVDEVVLVFLAKERDSRLSTFLRCTLPFSAVNPYTPFQAGDVPPEMYFGREEMVRALQQPSGSYLVYGGRQLGKSALLRQVKHKFHASERQRYAWITNTKLVFDTQLGKNTNNLWLDIRDNFKEYGLFPASIRSDKASTIQQNILKVMKDKPSYRVLIMFDEADEFLDADAANNFGVVLGLKELMLETQGRFKVIFAGLHNVQRFQGIPNQPLAHFGTPIVVGPLEPAPAEKLVKEPLQVLGYRFEDDSTVLRILSYTNYHPGLIQLFCYELLNNLRKHNRTVTPPYKIKQADVEKVYLKVRNNIRERFDWTLALDTRYQAISWSMIVDQLQSRDSFALPYAPSDILNLVRQWWPKGFEEIDVNELRGLLNEMCGLGVLVRNTDGKYRLRSPNLVRLMGAENDIEMYLLELEKKEPPNQDNSVDYHALVDKQTKKYSPFTYSQDRRLAVQTSGVNLIFASNALGLSNISHALRGFIPRENSRFELAPTRINNGKTLTEWVQKHKKSDNKLERLYLMIQPYHLRQDDLRDMVKSSFSVIGQQNKETWLRLFFLFDASTSINWLLLPKKVREELEDKADSVVIPRLWSRNGIKQLFKQQEIIALDDVLDAVFQSTGGWPLLIEELLNKMGAKDDPRPFLQEIQKELCTDGSALRDRFIADIGIPGMSEMDTHPIKMKWGSDGLKAFSKIIALLHKENDHGVPSELILPFLMDDDKEVEIPQDAYEFAIEYLEKMNILSHSDGGFKLNNIVYLTYHNEN